MNAVEIHTPSGRIILVSHQDAEFARSHSWYFGDRGYPYRISIIEGKRKNIFLHKDILKASGVDHISGNLLDCRRENLRPCNQSKNIANSKLYKTNVTGFKGVSYYKRNPKKPYISYIMVNYKNIHLGYFVTAKPAAQSYDAAAIKYFGEFARTNFERGS